jgi:preprotein translocase subunit SecY
VGSFYELTLLGIFPGITAVILISFLPILQEVKYKGIGKINSYRKFQQDATVYQNLLFHIYMKLNMFRATHRPSSGE